MEEVIGERIEPVHRVMLSNGQIINQVTLVGDIGDASQARLPVMYRLYRVDGTLLRAFMASAGIFTSEECVDDEFWTRETLRPRPRTDVFRHMASAQDDEWFCDMPMIEGVSRLSTVRRAEVSCPRCLAIMFPPELWRPR